MITKTIAAAQIRKDRERCLCIGRLDAESEMYSVHPIYPSANRMASHLGGRVFDDAPDHRL
jgi:hypothetical protein